MNTIPTSHGNLRPDQIMDECMYTSYATNRDLGVTKEGWIRMGMAPEVAEAYERRYSLETSMLLNAAAEAEQR